ncbi:S9 family peptidase [Kangiella aquimarina]|uniref:S9 family peptidase n=1 Tax=Kangiella aquimarina TaxID=261965 RepID=A0ABZ0X139_9GAMM|nr:S9 family peptidase [Kangiella aquimarina]WQG84306.1 S9 family peptidase [Kangiella aquimarina]
MKKLLISLSLLLASSGLMAKNDGMTLEDISKLQSVTSLDVSPNGEYIAFTQSKPRTPYVDEDGTAWNQLFVMKKGGEARPFITGEVSIGGVQWAHDSSAIYYTSKRGEDKHNSLYKIPVDGGESQQVLSFETDIGGYTISHDGSKLVFLAKEEDPKHLEKLDKKGFKAKVYEEDIKMTHAWLYELASEEDSQKPAKLDIKDHVLSVAFSPVNDELMVQTSPTSLIDDIYMKKSLKVVDLDGDIVASFKTEGKQGKAVWSTDGKQIAFLGANDYNDPTDGALYIANVVDETIYKRVANLTSHVMDIAWQGDDVIYIEHQGVESRIVRAAIKRKIADRPVVDYGNGIHSRLSVSNTGDIYAMTDTASHPREVYAFNADGFERLTNSNPWLADKALGKQVAYEYEARDGLKIQGVLVYPLNYKKGKRYPMIAFIHGGPEAHESNGWKTNYGDPAQYASAQGYFSFFPNYRGSTGRGDEFARLDQHGYADPEFTDILDGKLALVKDGMVDTDKVGITGGSYGGYATAWSSTALSEHYAAGVMFVGISNQLSKFGTTDIPNEMQAVHARAWPWDDYQWMLETSPIYHAPKGKTPLLIMHGEADTRVHPSQSMEMYRYLKTLGNAPVRLVLYPGEGHGNRKAAAQLDYSMRLMRWMDHYLKGKGGNPPPYDLKHEEKLENGSDSSDS